MEKRVMDTTTYNVIAMENALAELSENCRAADINRIRRDAELSEAFRKKHDGSGGMTVSEFQFIRFLFLRDMWTAITALYDIAWRRGYRSGQNAAKKRYKAAG